MGLPKKLSDLIEVALADLDACESDERYEINMHVWHDVKGDKCSVCLAGAVMAKTLGSVKSTWPQKFPPDIEDDLELLDRLRMGVRFAIRAGWGTKLEALQKIVDVAPEPKRGSFDRDYFEKLVVELRKVGE